jgi:hypothetical protein
VKKIALATLAALVFAASATAVAKPLVPVFIQALIKHKAGAEAYVPTRAPFRYQYLSYRWVPATHTLTIRVADKRYPNLAKHTVAFTVVPFNGNCAAGNQKSYQVDGNKTYSDAGVAWRCLNGVKILAAGPNLPEVALAQIVASGKRLR